MELSLKRASEAVSYFKSQGVEPSLLSAKGFGEADPVASNDTPEGRARNRRISIVLHRQRYTDELWQAYQISRNLQPMRHQEKMVALRRPRP